MILGVSILDNRLLLALHHGLSKEPEFLSFPIDIKLDFDSAPGKSVWKAAGQVRSLLRLITLLKPPEA